MVKRYFAVLLLLGACTDQLSSTEQLGGIAPHIEDAANNGGTQGFYFLAPLADAPSFSGTFNGTFSRRLRIAIDNVACDQSGNVSSTHTTVMDIPVYPATEQYKVTVNVGGLGLVTGNCYRIVPMLDLADLGYRDLQVTAGTPVAGFKKWGPGSNQVIAFRLENMDPDGDAILSHVDNCPNTSNADQQDLNMNGVGDACEVADSDNDGIEDGSDNCPNTSNSGQENSDGDSAGDACDGCTADPAKTDPGVCGCGNSDSDGDGDTTPDCNDGCTMDPNKTDPGVCGCGMSDADGDGDGTANCIDGCPLDMNKTSPGTCGCGTPDDDNDSNGTPDCLQLPHVLDAANAGGTPGFYFLTPLVTAPTFSGTFAGTFSTRLRIAITNIPCDDSGLEGSGHTTLASVPVYPASEQYKVTVNVAGLGLVIGQCYRIKPLLDLAPLGYRDIHVTAGTAVTGFKKWGPGSNQVIAFRLEDMDPDSDSILSHVDNCPLVSNSSQTDTDSNGVGDACESSDFDNDGESDGTDNCPLVPNPGQEDGDSDGLGDVCDGCSVDPTKTDPGVCGCGTADADSDGDGTLDCNDICPNDPDKTMPGVCGCGAADADTDGDKYLNCDDNCPLISNPGQEDSNTNGTGDACEGLCANVPNAAGWWAGDNTTEDSAGSADGAFIGGAGFGSGSAAVVGSASFAFSGTNFVKAPFSYSANPWSVSLWVLASEIQVKNVGLIASAAPQVFAQTFQIEWGVDGVYRFHGGEGNLYVTIGTGSTSAFQHIVVTYDGTTVSTYLDGAPVATGSWLLAPLKFDELKIGTNRAENKRFKGAIDDVMVFSRAITANEVSSIHAAGTHGVCVAVP
ncbi:MAG: thrombospondin type 3 repeat-containing protein [Kofleriaceae bacterium]